MSNTRRILAIILAVLLVFLSVSTNTKSEWRDENRSFLSNTEEPIPTFENAEKEDIEEGDNEKLNIEDIIIIVFIIVIVIVILASIISSIEKDEK